MFYNHVIEDAGNDNIAWHGWFKNQEDAQAEVNRLAFFFPRITFYIHPSNSKKEPEFITI